MSRNVPTEESENVTIYFAEKQSDEGGANIQIDKSDVQRAE